jgi:WD40 repeat protein
LVLVLIGDWGFPQILYYDSLKKSKVKTLGDFHKSEIRLLKYLPSNGYVASSSIDINIINPITWTSIRKYTGHTGTVNGFDQIDNDTIVSVSFDLTLQIWKISTGKTLSKFSLGSAAKSVRVISNSFQHVACGFFGLDNNLRIYNFSTGSLVKTLVGHSNSVFSIEILNEQFMASGSGDEYVIIWDLKTYSIKYKLEGHVNDINCVKRLSSNLLASAGDDNNIIIWDWLNGKFVRKLDKHSKELMFTSLDLYNEGTLISGSNDKTIKFWNISTGELIESINANIEISSLAMLTKGKIF